MGFNTVVVVMNDALDCIKDDKDFGKKLFDAALKTNSGKLGDRFDVSAGCYVNAATVVGCEHADVKRVYVMGGNTGKMTSLYMIDTGANIKEDDYELNILREAAQKLGYNLHRKPVRKNKNVRT